MRLRTITLAAAIISTSAAAEINLPIAVEQLRDGAAIPISATDAHIVYRLPGPPKGRYPDIVMMRLLEPAEIDELEALRRQAFDTDRPKLIAQRAKVIAANAALAKGDKPRPVPPEPTLENYDFHYVGMRNVFLLFGKQSYAATPTDHIYVVTLPPGEYVILGMSYGMGNMTGCLCMGSVRFEAKSGIPIDLGQILIGDASGAPAYPELAGYAGLNMSHRSEPPLFAMTVRPYAEGMALPSGLRTIPADYRAQGKIPNFFYSLITRMAPVKGVLDYRLDKVIDVKSGTEAP